MTPARTLGHSPSCGCPDCLTETALARLRPSRRAMAPQLTPRLRRVLREVVVEAYRQGREDEREGLAA